MSNWQLFRCNNCGWSTPGHYNFENNPELKGCLPDTDCPKCKFHDSVTEGEDCPVPDDIDAVRRNIADGASYPESL